MTAPIPGPVLRRISATLLLAALVACAEEEVPPPEPPPVYVARAIARDVVDRIAATGQLLAKAEATVGSQVGGQVTAVNVDEGSAVDAGETVIEIDPERRELEVSNAAARVLQAEAQLAEARRESNRVTELQKRGAASQAQLDEARTRLELARSQLAAEQSQRGLAERALRDASVGAPFGGLVARRFVRPGEYVQPGDPLFELVALDPVEVEFFLAEIDSSRVAVGQEVDVRVASQPGEVFRAEVSVVSPTIDSATRTRRVKGVIANPHGKLLPGTFARVDLGVAQRAGVVMIPKEAVQVAADGSVLFRLVGSDRVERLVVETGVYRDGLVEVRGGVAAGDWIVVRGQGALVDGSPVTLRQTDGTPTTLPADSRDGGPDSVGAVSAEAQPDGLGS